MAQQIINVGTNPNDGTGDTLRGAFVKTDDNFTDLYTNKQNTLVSGTNIKTINGSSVLGSGDLTISGGVTGSGTDNYIPRFNGTTALENSIIFDNATNVGVGTASPVDKLDVNGSLRLRGNTPSFAAVNNSGVIDYVPTSIFPTDPQMRIAALGSSTVGASILFQTGINSGSITERMRITPAGYVGIGTSTPSTTLQVVGTFKAGDFSNPSLDVGATEISANVDSNKIILNSSSAKLGYYTTGVELGVNTLNGARVYFENSIGNKFGLQESDNLLVTDNGIIQDTVTPSDATTPVRWIRINDISAGNEYLIPVYA
jgi:hypothetical protein